MPSLAPRIPLALLGLLGLLGLSVLLMVEGCGGGADGGGATGDRHVGSGGSDLEARAPAAGLAAVPRNRGGFPFTDVTDAAGIDFRHHNGAAGRRHYVETMAPGLALLDADGDGDLDVYTVDGGPLPGSPTPPQPVTNRLFLNHGDGTFEDATAASGAGDTGYGMGVTVGDYDGDGDPDLYVLDYGPNVLYENLGGGRFRAVEAGVEDELWSVSGAFLDVDGDGDLDLYVANYLDYDVDTDTACRAGDLDIYCSPELFEAAPDRLYRNDGPAEDGTVRFTDISEEAGVRSDGRGMGLAVGDLDEDGDPDLYVANDCSPNHYYVNDFDAGAHLREDAAVAGVAFSASGHTEGGMGVVTGDLLGDGRPAIFHTNFQKEPNRLFVALGGGFFEDRSLPSELGFPSTEMVSWGIAALDVEGDGDLDLAVANGHVFDNAAELVAGSSYAMPDQLFVSDGAGRFEAREFPGEPLSSRGLVAGDLDGDGDADLVVTSAGGPLRVWRNDTDRPERFLILDLRGSPPNTSAFGSRVTARVGGRLLVREVHGGGSYASHGDTRVYLGLGEAVAAESVEVRWADGSREELSEATADLTGGRVLTWRQGQGVVAERPLGEAP